MDTGTLIFRRAPAARSLSSTLETLELLSLGIKAALRWDLPLSLSLLDFARALISRGRSTPAGLHMQSDQAVGTKHHNTSTQVVYSQKWTKCITSLALFYHCSATNHFSHQHQAKVLSPYSCHPITIILHVNHLRATFCVRSDSCHQFSPLAFCSLQTSCIGDRGHVPGLGLSWLSMTFQWSLMICESHLSVWSSVMSTLNGSMRIRESMFSHRLGM